MAGTKRRLTEVDNINLQDDESKALKSQSSTVDANASLMTCELPPLCSTNPQHFASYDLFETHYLKFHSLNCVQCGKTFPSERFLELHITENHDPFAALKQERGDKIVCFDLYLLHVLTFPSPVDRGTN